MSKGQGVNNNSIQTTINEKQSKASSSTIVTNDKCTTYKDETAQLYKQQTITLP